MLQNASAGNHQCARTGVLENKLNLIWCLRRVERNCDSTGAENCQIDDRPFGAVLGNQGDAVAGFNSKIAQTERDVPDTPRELSGRDAQPFAASFYADSVRLVVTRNSG